MPLPTLPRLTLPKFTPKFTLTALLPLLLALAGAAGAATRTVTDSGDNGGATQLRQVLARAATGDTVVFAPAVTTITLNGNELQITRPLTVSGPGVTINANGKSRVFEISGGTASRPVALGGLTIEDGSTAQYGAGAGVGGGLLNHGTATLTGCTLTQNSATEEGGGLFNEGTLTLTACALTGDSAPTGDGYGGGLFNDSPGTMTLTGCALVGDSAGDGGGLYNAGTMTLTGGTLTGDSAGSGYGGGLYNDRPGTLTLTGCTLTGNSADYGGGGLFNRGAVTLTDDILYGDSGGEVYGDGQGTISASYCDIQGGYSGAGNLDADPLFVGAPADPHLRGGSPCAGAGTANAPAYRPFDLDGRPRPTPAYNAPSIGAYEAAPTGPFSLVVENISDALPRSLRAAVRCADDYGSATVLPAITFDPQVFAAFQTITLTSGELALSAPMTITAPAPAVAVSGNSASRVFEISGGTASRPVALGGLTITGGNVGSSGIGGGVLVNGGAHAALTGCTLTGDSALLGGGLLNDRGGTLTLTGCALVGDSATFGGGGGGLANGGTATLTNCTLTGDSAPGGYGGGLYNAGTATLTGCNLANDSATGGGGGGLYNAGTATLTGCTLTGDSANYGSGLGNQSTATLTDDILYGDTGGEIASYGTGTISASYCDIQGGYPGAGNLDADPQFVNAPTDLHVRPGSPVVGAGVAAAGNGRDITGATRADPPTVGAYEGQRAQTRTGLTSSLNPSDYGQRVTFTATVDTQGGPAPAGSVSFFLDGAATPAATVAVSGTTASYATSALAVGPHKVVATFTGAGFAASSGALTQTVNAATVTGVSAAWGGRGATLTAGPSLLPAGRGVDVPWLGVSSFTVTLSAPESLSASDVSVTGVKVASYGPVTVSGSGATYTVTLAAPVSLADRVTLSVGNANVTAFSGTLPVLPGDVSGDGAVGAPDLVLARNGIGAPYGAYGDVNGDGAVDVGDYALVRQRVGTRLP